MNRHHSTAIIPILVFSAATCRADDFKEILTGLKRAKESALNSEATASILTNAYVETGSEPAPVNLTQAPAGSAKIEPKKMLWSFAGERTFLRAEQEERGRYWDGSTWTSGITVNGVFYARSSPAANSSPNPIEEPISVGYRLPPAFQMGQWIADYAADHPPGIQKLDNGNQRLTWYEGVNYGTTLRLTKLSVDLNPKQDYLIVRTSQEDRYCSIRLDFGEFIGTVGQTSTNRRLEVLSAAKLGSFWLPTSVNSKVTDQQTTSWKILTLTPKASPELLNYYHDGDVVDRAGSRFVARADGSFEDYKPPETGEEQETRSDLVQYVLLTMAATSLILVSLYSRTILRSLRRPGP